MKKLSTIVSVIVIALSIGCKPKTAVEQGETERGVDKAGIWQITYNQKRFNEPKIASNESKGKYKGYDRNDATLVIEYIITRFDKRSFFMVPTYYKNLFFIGRSSYGINEGKWDVRIYNNKDTLTFTRTTYVDKSTNERYLEFIQEDADAILPMFEDGSRDINIRLKALSTEHDLDEEYSFVIPADSLAGFSEVRKAYNYHREEWIREARKKTL